MPGLDSDTRTMILDTLRRYAERKLTLDFLVELDHADTFPHDVLQELYDPTQLGLHLLFIPEEYDGLGGGAYDIYRVSELMAAIDLGIATGVLATFLGTDPISVGGTAAQKKLWMGRVAEESLLVAYGATEPQAGSDLAALATKAVPVSENGTVVGYKLSGQKQWISNGGVADLYTILANAPGGPSWFVVERGAEGFTHGKPEDKHGIRASNTAALFLEEVYVPADRLIGLEEGKGLVQAQAVFGYTRLMVGAFGLGAGWEAMRRAIRYAQERVQGGAPLSQKQGYTHKLIVPNVARLEAARTYIEWVAERLDGGEEGGLQTEGAVAKYTATEAGNKAAEDAIQAHGGYGYTKEYLVEKIKRDVRITTIYEGTSEIMEWTIARDRWQLHLKSRGAHFLEWAARLDALHAQTPDSGADYAALALRALAALLERCRVDRLTRNQHVLFRLGELVAWAETAAVFAERVVEKPTTAVPLSVPVRQTLSRIYGRQAALKVAADGLQWANGAGQTDPNLADLLNLPAIYAAQNGLVADMDAAMAALVTAFPVSLRRTARHKNETRINTEDTDKTDKKPVFFGVKPRPIFLTTAMRKEQMDTAERAIAVVGVGAILPDAPSAAAFWQNLLDRRYSITDVPADRWRAADYYDPDPKAPDKAYSKIGGWVRGFEFDWKRFRIPPRVAAAMDEGQQWALTIAADALADYGYPERPLDTERTAVVLGTAMGGELHYITNQRIAFPEYAHALRAVPAFTGLPAAQQQAILAGWRGAIADTFPPITEDSMPGELPNIVSGRVANVLNLRGPNFITDAACASSLAALEAAIEMLADGKVDAAICGGVDRNMGASTFVKFCKIGALSATGTRPFGDGADGFVMGEGAAAFLLKRLADAERDGDRIYAVIRGVGGSSDGKGKGITAPNPIGQQLAIQRAWENAGLDPATATLVEAHGTSTRVGDVVEVESLALLFGGAARHSIGLGSAKSNIGHLKAGAGAAGLLKAVLALHHQTLPPTLNAETPNPHIDFDNSPFYLLHTARPWPRRGDTPRRCGVSAYGFGGTNFHVVLEEHVPGLLTRPRAAAAAAANGGNGLSGERRVESAAEVAVAAAPARAAAPVRGILALGAGAVDGLRARLDEALLRVDGGWEPPREVPETAVLQAAERLIIDFGDRDELLGRLQKAQKALAQDDPAMWRALDAQGIFRGRGAAPGKLAFLFPGQGSQYVNMGRELLDVSPEVAAVFAAADRVMTPILGKPLTDYLFVDPTDKKAVARAEMALMQTEVTQPAMLTLDIALLKLLETYGFTPDMVMGHSLGEYAALIAAGIMPFADALEAAAARGDEMSKVRVEDNGKMAAVLAPIAAVEETLRQVSGYVVPANINSHAQCVIGGSSAGVDEAMALFQAQGYRTIPLPVSHAFHTEIVAPASRPLRVVLDRLRIAPPRLPLVANVSGAFYPTGVEAIKDILEKQIASPVQWVKGLETLYAAGTRTFVEVGPKRALWGFVRSVFEDRLDAQAIMTNHPKKGTLPAFNQALCALYAAGYGPAQADARVETSEEQMMNREHTAVNGNAASLQAVAELLAQALQQAPAAAQPAAPTVQVYDRHAPPTGSVVISGTGLGLPGAEKSVMDPDNALRILRGEQFVDLIPERFRKRILAKRITRLVKDADGNGRFETISNPDDVIKLAGRPGAFDLAEEYGVPPKLVEALDSTTQLAMAAGFDALREAGIPLVQTYRPTTTGKHLPDRWLLPEPLRDETGVIFASAFPGGDRFADEMSRYFTFQNRLDQLQMLHDLRSYTRDGDALRELDRRIHGLRAALEAEPYVFDRRFLFRILAMGHSQFAEYIGARGPNTQVNAACASTAQAVAIAEDWIRNGRCRRVIVIAADNVTGDTLMEWVGAGFLAVGAAATDDRVEEAALPFDRRRHGTLMGMGAAALLVESEDAVQARGMRGIVELLAAETSNSAFHGTRLDVMHIAQVMDSLVSSAERRFGLNRQAMAPQLVFMSHETYTPARGGSAAAEVEALRHTFGDVAREIIVSNTKGFTGHPMGVGIEDVIAVKILEYGIVPPVPNFREIDPDLGPLNLSRGGRYAVQYALHLAAGFGSQLSLTLTRRIPGAPARLDNPARYQRWLDDVSGYDRATTQVEKRVLRVEARGVPPRTPVPSDWRPGIGPLLRTDVGEGMVVAAVAPVKHEGAMGWQGE
ncbi:MAG: acyltransferase domain-containing protein, partial [Anaerolineales bacterium]|nr:acyltransferase domain-containing protein [Anaerolineales bacterium]